MAKLVILTSSWPRPRSSHIWPLIQNFDESNCHLFFITSILALKTMKSVQKWQSYTFWGHWRSNGGHGVVSVVLEPKNTHRYWKNLPNKKKISFLAQFKVPNTPSPKYLFEIFNFEVIWPPDEVKWPPFRFFLLSSYCTCQKLSIEVQHAYVSDSSMAKSQEVTTWL